MTLTDLVHVLLIAVALLVYVGAAAIRARRFRRLLHALARIERQLRIGERSHPTH